MPQAGSDGPEVATGETELEAGTSARGRYNRGLDDYQAGSPEAAAEAFLAARDDAGPDPELRYRAAFNLGLALAAQAGFAGIGAQTDEAAASAQTSDEPPMAPEQAIETLRQSAAWFNDAVRLAPPGDDDARINLELVSRWILQLADQLNEGDRLEARLDRLIDDQRGLRDQLRRLLADVVAEDASAEPVGFKNEFESLASRERVLMAEVADCVDLADEERLFIEQTPAEERPPDRQSRVYQLAALTDYLERARQSLSDARRRLRRLEGERGHRRVDAALAELKRAREQLLDPVTVLQAVARDEQELMAHTGARAAIARGAISLGEAPMGWLTDKHLAQRQEDIAARTGGVLGQFEMVAASDPSTVGGIQATQAKRSVAAAREAVAILEGGLANMRAAIAALESGEPAAALTEEQHSLTALAEAIELFADIKNLIELAHADQQRVVALLTPDDDTSGDGLTATQRETMVSELVVDNQRRAERLRSLLEEEAATAAAEAADQDDETRQATQQRYQLAEALRGRVAEGLAKLAEDVGSRAVEAARAGAGETLRDLQELRRLFFSIVEHLAALRADQADTHDRTATLQVDSSSLGDGFAPEVATLAERQARHAQFGDQLAAALAQQADAAVAPPAPDTSSADAAAALDPQAGQRLAKAAEEVRQAGGRMLGAATMLADGAVRATSMSPDFEPALEDQLAAIEHLENALRELVPPQQRPQQGQEQGQDEQQQQRQPQPSEDEQMSQRQALKRLQAIRDREAERQRRRGDPGRPEPVEKDW